MKLSERMRNAEMASGFTAGHWADEVAQLEAELEANIDIGMKAINKVYKLEAEVAKWEKIANEEHAQSAHIAMRNGELEAENERLRYIEDCACEYIEAYYSNRKTKAVLSLLESLKDALEVGDDDETE